MDRSDGGQIVMMFSIVEKRMLLEVHYRSYSGRDWSCRADVLPTGSSREDLPTQAT